MHIFICRKANEQEILLGIAAYRLLCLTIRKLDIFTTFWLFSRRLGDVYNYIRIICIFLCWTSRGYLSLLYPDLLCILSTGSQ